MSEDRPDPAGRREKSGTSTTTQTAVVRHGHQGKQQTANDPPGPGPGSRQELALTASTCLYLPGTPHQPSEPNRTPSGLPRATPPPYLLF